MIQGEHYRWLKRAGVRAHLRRADGQFHGLFSLASMLPSARGAALWGTGRLSHELKLDGHTNGMTRSMGESGSEENPLDK